MTKLKDLPIDKFSRFTRLFMDEITGSITISYSKTGMDNIDTLKQELYTIITKLVFSPTPSQESILNSFDEDKKSILLETLKSRKLDVAQALLKKHNSSINPVLNYFDWSVKFVCGSSSCTTLQYPLFKLDLIALHNQKNVPTEETISLELDKNQLDTLISVLEGCIS